MIGKHGCVVCVLEVGRQYQRSTSTIRTILKQKGVIKGITPANGVEIMSKLRTAIHEKMGESAIGMVEREAHRR